MTTEEVLTNLKCCVDASEKCIECSLVFERRCRNLLLRQAYGTIKKLSSQVPPKAKWIYHDTHYQCSNCGAITASGMANYCFRCGAKMEEEI